MAHEGLPRTEQRERILALIAAHQPSEGDNSCIIFLDRNTCDRYKVGKADFLQLFSAESVVRHGGFMMRYDPDRDYIFVNKIAQSDAAAATIAAVEPTQKVDLSMSAAERASALAKREYADDPKLQREFGSEAAYLSYRKAELSGRARVFGRPKAEIRP